MTKLLELLKSGTVRMALVALIALTLDKLGLADKFPASEKVLDGALDVLQYVGMLGAAAYRIFRPNPNLTVAAVKKEAEIGLAAIAVPSVQTAQMKSGTMARSPWIVGVLALALALLSLVGCTGTAAAYKATEGHPDKVAYVVLEHYDAVLQEAIKVKAEHPTAATTLQRADSRVGPAFLRLGSASQAYKDLHNAQTEAELSAAIDEASTALSDLIDALKEIK